MSTKALTLTEFLSARFDEDEASLAPIAQSGIQLQVRAARLDGDGWTVIPESFAGILASRLTAEVEAKRAVVREHPAHGFFCDRCVEHTDTGPVSEFYPCQTLRALASVYANDPDFNEDWR